MMDHGYIQRESIQNYLLDPSSSDMVYTLSFLPGRGNLSLATEPPPLAGSYRDVTCLPQTLAGLSHGLTPCLNTDTGCPSITPSASNILQDPIFGRQRADCTSRPALVPSRPLYGYGGADGPGLAGKNEQSGTVFSRWSPPSRPGDAGEERTRQISQHPSMSAHLGGGPLLSSASNPPLPGPATMPLAGPFGRPTSHAAAGLQRGFLVFPSTMS
ncbi:hypothetical protein LY76DRAFT_34659 [Colletotrichum caudatum]|nr:hypothetical protein LY76DRAFT_34659 [Colletotrichum caudatum]